MSVGDEDEAAKRYTPSVRAAYHALLELTQEERGLVLCWFCNACRRHMPPGDHCTCEDPCPACPYAPARD